MMLPSHPSKSRADLEADLALARQDSDFAAEAACLVALGDIAKENEEYDLAQGLYGQAWASYEKAGDQSKTVQAILSLTDVYARLAWDEENFEAAFFARCFCDQALRIAEQAQDYAAQGRTMKIKADLIRFDVAEREIKQSIYEHALKLCKQGGDLEGQANAIMQLGIIQMEPGTYEQAKILFSSALNLYQQAYCNEGAASALVRLGEVAGCQQRTLTKKNYYTSALKIYEQLDQPLKVAEMLGELGQLVRVYEKDYELALSYHKQEALLYDQHSEDPVGYENALSSIGHVYEAAKNYEEAQIYYTKELALCDETDTLLLASRLFALARVYAAMDDINTGRQYAQQAIKTSGDNPHRDHLFYRIWDRWLWGKIEYQTGYHETGRALCQEAITLAEEIPFGRHILDVWQQDLAAMNCPTPPNTEASQ
jgi:tetratricopeptide (TPR) repeat protein